MTETNDTPELILRRWEELYALTKSELAMQEERFDGIEEKVVRYFALTTFLLGAAMLGFKEFIRLWQTIWSNYTVIFLSSYILFMIFVVSAVVFYMLSLAFYDIRGIPMDGELIAHFRDNRYVDVLSSMSSGAVDAHLENQLVLRKKLGYAKWGYFMTNLVFVFAVLTAIFYIVTVITSAAFPLNT